VRFDGYGSYEFRIGSPDPQRELSTLAFASNSSIQSRSDFLSKTVQTGSVSAFDGQRQRHLKFKVFHVASKEVQILRTYPGANEPVKNVVGLEPSFYKEAMQIVQREAQLDKITHVMKGHEFCGFSTYIPLQTTFETSDEIFILGPDFGDNRIAVANFTQYDGSKTEVFIDKKFKEDPQCGELWDLFPSNTIIIPSEDVPSPLKIDYEPKTLGCKVYLHARGCSKKLLFQLSQNLDLAVFDKPMWPEDYLMLIGVQLYFDLVASDRYPLPAPEGFDYDPEGRILNIDLVDSDQYYFLPDKFKYFYANTVIRQNALAWYCDRANGDFYTRDNMLYLKNLKIYDEKDKSLTEDRMPLPIISESKNAACFALTVAKLISLMFDGSIYTQLRVLANLASFGGVYSRRDNPTKESKRVIWGNSSLIFNENLRNFDTLFGKCALSGHVNVLTPDTPGELDVLGRTDGYCIVGFDPRTDNASENSPDHYVLCYKDGNALILVYDSALKISHLPLYHDISGKYILTKQGEKVIYSISEPNVVSVVHTDKELFV
jgi:hypothetical protein